MEMIQSLWNRARESISGIQIRTDCPTQLFDELLRYRFNTGDPELFEFALLIKGKEVWVVRKKTGTVRTDGAYAPLEE